MDVGRYLGSPKGLSLPEVLVVIGILGIIAAIGISAITNVGPAASARVAERNLNLLNGALQTFSQANWDLVLASRGDTSDEESIYLSLRYRDSDNPSPGSPYLQSNVKFSPSSDSTGYRAQWTGRMFQMLSPGQDGSGMDLLEMMGDPGPDFLTTPPVPPQ